MLVFSFFFFWLASLLGNSGGLFLGLYSPFLNNGLTLQVEKPSSAGLLVNPLMEPVNLKK